MFRNIKVFWKFAIVAILIPATVIITATSALLNSRTLKYEYDNLYGFMLIPIMTLDQGNLAREQLGNDLLRLQLADIPPDQIAALKAHLLENDKAMQAVIEQYEAEWVTTLSPEYTAILAGLGKQALQAEEAGLLSNYHSVYSRYAVKRDALLAGQSIDSATVEADLVELESVFTRLVAINRQFAEISNESAQAAISSMRLQIILIGIFSSLVAVIITYAISRDITLPLQNAIQMIQEMGRGHLGNRLRFDRRDEIGLLANAMDSFADDLQNNVIGGLREIAYGNTEIKVIPNDDRDEIAPALLQTAESLRALNMAIDFAARLAKGEIPRPITETYLGNFETLKNNLNAMSERLRDMLAAIASSAANISAASSEILASTTLQATGAREQSAAITETTATVDQLKATAEQSVKRAQEVVDGANQTVRVSHSGQVTVDDTIRSMELIKEKMEDVAGNILALSEQTLQIGEIISTVNQIATQSNMLALNASVEAARAGEHGKGFAVVAFEMRTLADQSKEATVQVRQILSEIQKATNTAVMATEEGTKVVEQGGQLMAITQAAIGQLSTVIEDSSRRAAQVVAGGRQQAMGVSQIAMAMQNINTVMIQNLTSIRQAEKAAQDLNLLSLSLLKLVEKYSV